MFLWGGTRLLQVENQTFVEAYVRLKMAIRVGFSWPLQTRPNHHLIFLKKARQGILLALMCRCNGVQSPLKTSRTFVTKPKGFLFGAAPIISMLSERRGITNFTSGTPWSCPAWDGRWCHPISQMKQIRAMPWHHINDNLF